MMINILNVRAFTKISFFFLLILFSCRGNSDNPVPNVPVNIQINILLPSYADLQTPGGYAYVNGGVKGIIVYRKSLNEFVCLDRMSTAEGGYDCDPLDVDPDNYLFLVDQCSDAVYSLLDGSVTSGSASFPLRSYQYNYDGYSTLYIYN